MRMMHTTGSAKQALDMLSQVTGLRLTISIHRSPTGAKFQIDGMRNWLIRHLHNPRRLDEVKAAWADCVRTALDAGLIPAMVYMDQTQNWTLAWPGALHDSALNQDIHLIERTYFQTPQLFWEVAQRLVGLDLSEGAATCSV